MVAEMRHMRYGTETWLTNRCVTLLRARRAMLFTTASTQALACNIIVSESQPLESRQARQLYRDRAWVGMTADVVSDIEICPKLG